MQPKIPAAGKPSCDARTYSQVRRTHPLLGAFPLAVITLATFLVLFTLMMAWRTAGADRTLISSTSTALVPSGSRPSTVRTRTSGSGAMGATATPVAASEQSSATTSAIVTRASGTAGSPGGGDD